MIVSPETTVLLHFLPILNAPTAFSNKLIRPKKNPNPLSPLVNRVRVREQARRCRIYLKNRASLRIAYAKKPRRFGSRTLLGFHISSQPYFTPYFYRNHQWEHKGNSRHMKIAEQGSQQRMSPLLRVLPYPTYSSLHLILCFTRPQHIVCFYLDISPTC